MALLKLSFLLLSISSFTHATPIHIRPHADTGKRGIAFEDESFIKLFGGLTWGYNWRSTGSKTSVPGSFEYVPMLGSDDPVLTANWAMDVVASVESGARHVLSFNEPDHCGASSACMQDIARTVASHKQYVQPIAEQYPQLRIGAPAVTNGELSPYGTPMGAKFLENFISECDAQGIKIDFVVAHWFDEWPASASERAVKFEYFKDRLQAIHESGGKRNVWVTEFGVYSGDQEDFLRTVMPWMDAQGWIERYAFHFAGKGALVTEDGRGLTALGEVYTGSECSIEFVHGIGAKELIDLSSSRCWRAFFDLPEKHHAGP